MLDVAYPSAAPGAPATARLATMYNAIDALAAIGRAGGGFKTIARHVDALDDAKKAKIEEINRVVVWRGPRQRLLLFFVCDCD